LKVGESQYTAFFATDGIPLDDLLIYQMGEAHYLIVVNAANNDKDWAWANGVLRGEVMIDPNRPWVRWQAAEDGVMLRDLRQPGAGEDMRQNWRSRGQNRRTFSWLWVAKPVISPGFVRLSWSGITHATLGGFDLWISRTGYTGERVAYELFVHPDRIVALWDALMEAGAGVSVSSLAALPRAIACASKPGCHSTDTRWRDP
jgi:glycine hydroxymethyltransferase